MLTACAKARVAALMFSSNPLGVTNHGTPVAAALPDAAAAMASWSAFTPTNATAAPGLPATAPAISPTADAQSAPPAGANLTAPASSRPLGPSASAIDSLIDRPQASSRTTVTTELTLASAITWTIKWPCLPAGMAVRNRLSPGIDSDSASEA